MGCIKLVFCLGSLRCNVLILVFLDLMRLLWSSLSVWDGLLTERQRHNMLFGT